MANIDQLSLHPLALGNPTNSYLFTFHNLSLVALPFVCCPQWSVNLSFMYISLYKGTLLVVIAYLFHCLSAQHFASIFYPKH